MKGPFLNRDWVGLRVRLNHQVSNMVGILPKGTEGTVSRYGQRGIEFKSDKCEHCGVQVLITRMERFQFTILTPEEKWPDTSSRTNKKYAPRHPAKTEMP